MSRSIKVSEFRRKCFAILDSVARTRDEVVITKHANQSQDFCRTVAQDAKKADPRLRVFSKTDYSSRETSSRLSTSNGMR